MPGFSISIWQAAPLTRDDFAPLVEKRRSPTLAKDCVMSAAPLKLDQISLLKSLTGHPARFYIKGLAVMFVPHVYRQV
jgi:hypothetical protein